MDAIQYVKKIMDLMEADGLTQGEVERVIKWLPEEVEKNSERLRKSKPFIVSK